VKLTHIRLLVADYDACFRFYRDVLGFEVTWGAEGEGYADFNTGNEVALALFQREVMAEAVGKSDLPLNASGQDTSALVFGMDNLDATVEQLKQRGASFVTEPQDRPEWGIRTAHLRDPDGNLIELNSALPAQEWTEELREEAGKDGGAA
jgi:lactoylglutathione lyase